MFLLSQFCFCLLNYFLIPLVIHCVPLLENQNFCSCSPFLSCVEALVFVTSLEYHPFIWIFVHQSFETCKCFLLSFRFGFLRFFNIVQSRSKIFGG
ncbi:hypothetical protein ES332_D10G261100v1 [Gossypium tomentosum]|uniref:Uncharacterized protein n=1 Tax=Gossypium tomentosum TaxID=34277 RepID=A0A5D2J8N6_GOSTO|nr:hypothetical protein ES332_D10G261100v1 [Gossypium tomentosum]